MADETLPGSAFTDEVLATLRCAEPMTLAQLSVKTGLSRPTLTRATNLLIRAGWVEASEPIAAKGAGRPASFYRFRSERGLAIGVDVDEREIHLRAVDGRGDELANARVEMLAVQSGADRLDAIVAAIEHFARSVATDPLARVIGIAVPATVNLRGHATASPTIPEWADEELGDQFERRLGCPVLVENGVHIAALAEYSSGVARHSTTFAYIWIHHRISSAFVLDGRLHRGSSGAAGTVGEMDILGWRSAPEALLGRRPDGPDDFVVSARDTLATARSGDQESEIRVTKFVDDIARGLAALCLVTDPEIVVLGGIGLEDGPELNERIRARIRSYSHSVNPPLEASHLGERAIVIGACSLALDHLVEHELGLVRAPRSHLEGAVHRNPANLGLS